jgi:hypothetical protein
VTRLDTSRRRLENDYPQHEPRAPFSASVPNRGAFSSQVTVFFMRRIDGKFVLDEGGQQRVWYGLRWHCDAALHAREARP